MDRIDHGLNASDDPELMADLVRRDLCLTGSPVKRTTDPSPQDVDRIRQNAYMTTTTDRARTHDNNDRSSQNGYNKNFNRRTHLIRQPTTAKFFFVLITIRRDSASDGEGCLACFVLCDALLDVVAILAPSRAFVRLMVHSCCG